MLLLFKNGSTCGGSHLFNRKYSNVDMAEKEIRNPEALLMLRVMAVLRTDSGLQTETDFLALVYPV